MNFHLTGRFRCFRCCRLIALDLMMLLVQFYGRHCVGGSAEKIEIFGSLIFGEVCCSLRLRDSL